MTQKEPVFRDRLFLIADDKKKRFYSWQCILYRVNVNICEKEMPAHEN